jgi:hypothetical protein
VCLLRGTDWVFICDAGCSGTDFFPSTSPYQLNMIPPLLHIYHSTTRKRRTSGRKIGTFKQSSAPSDIVLNWTGKYVHLVLKGLMEASVTKFGRLAGNVLKLFCDKFGGLAGFAVSICRCTQHYAHKAVTLLFTGVRGSDYYRYT